MKNGLKVNGEFRAACSDYWAFVFSVSGTRKQVSPFIVVDVKRGTVDAVYYYAKLHDYDEQCNVFQAWPGEWRTDIFAYTIKDFKKRFNAKSKK